MVKKNKNRAVVETVPLEHVDCACLIHDTLYPWDYVDKLYNALCRNLSLPVKMHVYTESNRVVPGHMLHHALEEWPGVRGPKRSWWYKIQLFNPRHHRGPMLYLDLDTVIVGNLDWVWRLPSDRFWAVQDFKYLFRPSKISMNSSMMWFDPAKFAHIYQHFDPGQIAHKRTAWHGDQDYLHEVLGPGRENYFEKTRVQSWRWQLKDGGFDFRTRKYLAPGTGTHIPDSTSVLIFHGSPKPHEIKDHVIQSHWC